MRGKVKAMKQAEVKTFGELLIGDEFIDTKGRDGWVKVLSTTARNNQGQVLNFDQHDTISHVQYVLFVAGSMTRGPYKTRASAERVRREDEKILAIIVD